MCKFIVLVYKDYGQWIESPIFLYKMLSQHLDASLFSIRFTDAREIIHLDVLSNPDIKMLCMPGAHARGYEDKLHGLGNEKIREFVKRGNVYLGICGGAYYAAEQIIFKGQKLHIQQKGSLGLFKGIAKGSLPKLTRNILFNETLNSSNYVNLFSKHSDLIKVFYNGGCQFIPYDNNYEVIAYYKDLLSPNIAIIKSCYAKGTVLLVGVHLEYNVENLTLLYKDLYLDYLEKQHYTNIIEQLSISLNDGSYNKLVKYILATNMC